MASGTYDSNAIVPITTSITVGTTAVALKSSASLAVKFSVANANASNAIYIGDSNVSSIRFTQKLTSGQTVNFGETKMYRNESQSYDLNRFFAVATSAAQVAVLTVYGKAGSSTGAF